MNKAEFKAIREQVGASRAFLAHTFGVQERSVKRWERPDGSNPPEEVCELLADMRQRQLDMIDYAVDKADAADSNIVNINYYSSQEEYDFFGRDKGDFMQANANARAVAIALETLGYEVVFRYPGDPDWVETPRNE